MGLSDNKLDNPIFSCYKCLWHCGGHLLVKCSPNASTMRAVAPQFLAV